MPKKMCPVCGRPVTENAYVCLFCGCHVRQYQPPVASPTRAVPPTPTYTQPKQPAVKTRCRTSAGVLGIVVGALGVHNFYMGYIGKGLTQLLVSVLGGFITGGLSVFAMWLWALIEGILILTDRETVDANGNKMRD